MNSSAVFRHVMEGILNPFTMAWVVFGLLLLRLCLRGDSRAVRAGLMFIFIGFIFFSMGWFSDALTNQLEKKYPIVNTPDPDIHWIVVLGGGKRKHANAPMNHLLTCSSMQRLLEGVRLYRKLPGSKLILSGGGVDGPKSEAELMASLTSWFLIPSRDVLQETVSINTADQAVEIKHLVHQEPFYLVTSGVHMPRSMALFLKQGLHPVPAPSDYPYDQGGAWKNMVPRLGNLLTLSKSWHEGVGMIWGVIRGKV